MGMAQEGVNVFKEYVASIEQVTGVKNLNVQSLLVGEQSDLPPIPADLSKLVVKELVALLKAYKQPHLGKKAELIAALLKFRDEMTNHGSTVIVNEVHGTDVEDGDGVVQDESDEIVDGAESDAGSQVVQIPRSTPTLEPVEVTVEYMVSFTNSMDRKYKCPDTKKPKFVASIYDPKDLQECYRILNGVPEDSKFRIAPWHAILMGFGQQAVATTVPAATSVTTVVPAAVPTVVPAVITVIPTVVPTVPTVVPIVTEVTQVAPTAATTAAIQKKPKAARTTTTSMVQANGNSTSQSRRTIVSQETATCFFSDCSVVRVLSEMHGCDKFIICKKYCCSDCRTNGIKCPYNTILCGDCRAAKKQKSTKSQANKRQRLESELVTLATQFTTLAKENSGV